VTLATVTHLFQRRCWNCVHFEEEEDDNYNLASHCSLWGEDIHDERIAGDCPSFQKESTT
jgi:hypothetical protein